MKRPILVLASVLLAALVGCGGGGSSASGSGSGSGGGSLPSTPTASAPVAGAASMAALPDFANGVHFDGFTSASTPDGFYEIAATTSDYNTALTDVLLVNTQGAYQFVGHLPQPQIQGASVYVPGTGLLVLGGADPTWIGTDAITLVTPTAVTPFAHLGAARFGATACLLKDGKVLVVGGNSDHTSQTTEGTAEVFDPVSKTTLPTSPLVVPSSGSGSARVFPLPDGRAFLVDSGQGDTQIYDPTTNAWTSGGPVGFIGANFGVAFGQVGSKIWLGGGYSPNPTTGTTQYFDYGGAIDTSAMSAGWYESAWQIQTGERERSYATTVVSNGKMVLIGGWTASGTSGFTYVTNDEIFDPTNPYPDNAWSRDTITRCPGAFVGAAGVLPSGQIVVQPDDGKADAKIWGGL